MNINNSQLKLAEYILSNDDERLDYIGRCIIEGKNPLFLHENKTHIYAHAIYIVARDFSAWQNDNFYSKDIFFIHRIDFVEQFIDRISQKNIDLLIQELRLCDELYWVDLKKGMDNLRGSEIEILIYLFRNKGNISA